MSEIAKDSTYRLARACLRTLAPGDLEELDLVFESLYRAVVESLSQINERSEEENRAQRSEGLPFEASIAELAVVGLVVWYSARIVDSIRRMREAHLPTLILHLARELARKAERPEEEVLPEIEGLIETLFAWEPRPADASEEAAQDLPDLRLFVAEKRHGPEIRVQVRLELGAVGAAEGLANGLVALRREPEAYVRDLLGIVEGLRTLDPADVPGRLQGIGSLLFREVLPETIQDALWELRDTALSLQIDTDEAWIPWELLVLCHRRTDERGPYLGELFALSRSPAGFQTAPQWLPLAEIALVVPETRDLRETARERDFVTSLERKGRCRVTRIPARLGAVRDALASGHYDAYHFAGHATARSENPEKWGFELEECELLTSVDLPATSPKRARPPFVFLNGCAAGRGARTLSRLGGLAHAFLRTGAAAVVAPIWSVGDAAAADFAELFYGIALNGPPIGEALRCARRDFREQSPTDSAWLAYAAFAHPSTRLGLEDQPVQESPNPVG